jgi:Bacterial PH domain
VDNSDDELARRWSAPVPAVVVGLVAAVGLLAWVVLGVRTGSLDGPGRLLLGVAGVAVGGAALFGLRARPRLAADEDGLVLRGVLVTRSWPWARVDAVRVMRMRRLGLPAAYLEIEARDDDGSERLLVLGRLELGTDPVDVAEALQAHRADAGRVRSGTAAAEGGRVADDRAEGQVAQDDRDEQDDDDPTGDGEARGRS